MSATNRGDSERTVLDAYPTPLWCVSSFLDMYQFPTTDLVFFDPCVGEGNIVKGTKSKYPNYMFSGVDIDSQYESPLLMNSDRFLIKDFFALLPEDISYLTYEQSNSKFDVIFTNPPYKLAFEFLKKCLELAPTVIMLLRLNFLASKKRCSFLQSNMPDVYVLPRRPSFKKTKKSTTDACEYGWFVWDTRSSGKLHILNC